MKKRKNKLFSLTILIVISFILFFPSIVFAFSEEIEESFKKAQQIYDKAIGLKAVGMKSEEAYQLFEEASSIYLKLINKYNLHNAYLYYNLGNCYYHMREIGEAIYYYKIALRLNSSYKDIKKNLNEARNLVENYIEDKNKNDSIIEVLFFWHYLMSFKLKMWIGIVFFILIWVFASINLFIRKKWLTGLIIAFAIISFIFLFSITIQYINAQNDEWGVVIDKGGVSARKGPGENYEESFLESLSEGIEFSIIEKENDWYKVKLKNNEICWLPESSIKTLENPIEFE